MSQVMINTTVAPLAEVTKSRPSIENSLNNIPSGQKPSTPASSTKKSKKNKNNQSSPAAEKEGPAEHQAIQHQDCVPLSSKASHKDYIRPWSSMTTQELAQWAKETGLDQEEEGAAVPSRRRVPKNTQVKTTTTTVPNTPVSANPTSRKQPSTSFTNTRSAGSSPLYAQPPQFPSHHGGSPQMPSTSSFEQAMSFSSGNYAPAAGRSSTPPEEALPRPAEYAFHQEMVEEQPVYVVSVRQNDPYSFNVIGDASPSSVNTSVMGAYASYYASQSNNLLNASLDSDGTVGYVNSAEVSPVKAGQQQDCTGNYTQMTFTAYPQRRTEVEETMNRSATSDSTPSARKHQRIYVNGRPVIKA